MVNRHINRVETATRIAAALLAAAFLIALAARYLMQ